MRARQLGRKWVLRACGRALFREVGQRWEAGEREFRHWRPRNPNPRLAAHRSFAEVVVQDQAAVEEACLRQKVYGEPKFFLTRNVALGLQCLAYMCNLADSMGYHTAVEALEKVWKRALKAEIKGLSRILFVPPKDKAKHINYLKDCFRRGTSGDLDSGSFLARFPPMPRVMGLESIISNFIRKEVFDIFGSEIVAVFWLVDILVCAEPYFPNFCGHEGMQLFYSIFPMASPIELVEG